MEEDENKLPQKDFFDKLEAFLSSYLKQLSDQEADHISKNLVKKYLEKTMKANSL